jgi:nitroreductase
MLDAIKNRRSYRDFLDKAVEAYKLNEILKAAQFAPTARNLRLWEFIVVKNKKTRDKLSQTKTNSRFANQAPVILVIASKDDGQTNYWVEDGSIAAAFIYLEAENQGLGTCFIQVFNSLRPDGSSCEKYVKKILGIPEKVHVLCLMPIGYSKQKIPGLSVSAFDAKKVHNESY